MDLLFGQDWFLSEVHGFLCWGSSQNTAIACRDYWQLYWKPNTVICIDLSRQGGWKKHRHSLFKNTDIVGIVVKPPKLSRGLEHAGNTRKKFRKLLEEYWLVEHPFLRFVEYRHHQSNNFPVDINTKLFVEKTNTTMKPFGFYYIKKPHKTFSCSSLWTRGDDFIHPRFEEMVMKYAIYKEIIHHHQN